MRAKGPYRVILSDEYGEHSNTEEETLKDARHRLKVMHAEQVAKYPQTDFDTKVYDANGVCIEHLYNVADTPQ